MIGLKSTLNVRISTSQSALTAHLKICFSSKKKTGHRQLGRAPRRVRQRAQKQSKQWLGQRRRRDRLHREACAAHLRRARRGLGWLGRGRAGRVERAQGAARGRAARGHRALSEAPAPAGRAVGAVRRQRGGAAEQQARDARHAHRGGRQRGLANEGVGKDS